MSFMRSKLGYAGSPAAAQPRATSQPCTSLRGPHATHSICGRAVASAEYSARAVFTPYKVTFNTNVIKRVPRRPVTCQATTAPAVKKGESLLTAERLSKSHDGDKLLFDDLTFTVARGECVAVIGPNGCGKSSLLRVIAGVDDQDDGAINMRKGTRVNYLAQDPKFDPGMSALEAVLQSDLPAARVVQRYTRAMAECKEGELSPALTKAIDEMNAEDGWTLEATARRVLSDVGLTDVDAKCGKMSGGQQRRVAVAAAFLSAPDLLILDEPTNHMDVDFVRWLEGEIKSRGMATLLVSHDRAFMESCCTRMLEMDAGSVHSHMFGGPGSYLQLRRAIAERRAAQAAAAANAATLLRKEAEWMSRQPQGRQTKQRARQDNFYKLVEIAGSGPREASKVDFGSDSMKRQGSKVMVLKNVGFKLPNGRQILKNVNYDFAPGERIGVCGPNGAGKSTFLNVLADKAQLHDITDGQIDVGINTTIGYFEQHPPSVREDIRIIDYISEIADKAAASRDTGFDSGDIPEVLLEKLGFPRSKQSQPVGLLSGGEMRRLHLAGVLTSRPNFLILDEPTNDMDLGTIEVMEDLLAGYKGVLLCASHDRAFMNGLLDSHFVLEGDGLVRSFDGSYDDYLEYMDGVKAAKAEREAAKRAAEKAAKAAEQAAAAEARAAKEAPKKALKMGYREKLELEKLETELEEAEARQEELQAKMEKATSDGDFELLAQITEEIATLSEVVEAKTDRWLELAEMAEAAG